MAMVSVVLNDLLFISKELTEEVHHLYVFVCLFHSLDVEFSQLGLAVVDEEQRYG